MMNRTRFGLRGLILGAVGLCALLLSGCYPPVSESDPYVAVAYTANEISLTSDVIYGQGERVTGEIVDLKLDVFAPPSNGAARPTLVLVHGGNFVSGAKEDVHEAARAWAQRGYVAVALGYRLGLPPLDDTDAPIDNFDALNAGADGQLAVRWLRANATTYEIDPDRLALLGSSAGAALAQITALNLDLTTDGANLDFSYVPTAVAGTGATLIGGIRSEIVTSDLPAAPLLMHHYELDTETGESDAAPKAQCTFWQEANQSCMVVVSPGEGHVLGLEPDGPLGLDSLMPFFAVELDLANAPTP